QASPALGSLFRLRAGLCDRCMVTQELAKKKQNEYETSHFQSLQHIFILSTYRSWMPLQLWRAGTLHMQTCPPAITCAVLPAQRIANQLHGTIALVRPGSQPCPLGKTSAETATSPPARKPLLSPEREHSPSLEAASSCEALKLTARKEQLCLLNQHLSLHQLGLGGQCPAANRSNSCPSPLFRAREAEGRTRAQDEWEDPAAIFELPGAVVYMRDQHLEGRLQLLKPREKLQCFLTHHRRAGVAPPADMWPPSPRQSPAVGSREDGSLLKDPLEGREEKHPWLNRDHLEQREKTEAARDCAVDTPLDLSDYGRRRETLRPTRWHQSPKQGEARSPGPDPQAGVLPRAEKSHLASGQRLPATPPPATHESEQTRAKEEEEEKDAATHPPVSRLAPWVTWRGIKGAAWADSGERPARGSREGASQSWQELSQWGGSSAPEEQDLEAAVGPSAARHVAGRRGSPLQQGSEQQPERLPALLPAPRQRKVKAPRRLQQCHQWWLCGSVPPTTWEIWVRVPAGVSE
uniref:RBBP8 N-terminal like n=1 Tax=Crocodylus porosus TaxID=8502 RepID=A0A7M4FUB9_CROPO